MKFYTHLLLCYQYHARIVLNTTRQPFSHGHSAKYRNESTCYDGLACNRYINLSVLLLPFFSPFVLYHIQTFQLKRISMPACRSQPFAPACRYVHSCTHLIRVPCQTQRPINVVIKLRLKHGGTIHG
jgi:hypothetical protein